MCVKDIHRRDKYIELFGQPRFHLNEYNFSTIYTDYRIKITYIEYRL